MLYHSYGNFGGRVCKEQYYDLVQNLKKKKTKKKKTEKEINKTNKRGRQRLRRSAVL